MQFTEQTITILNRSGNPEEKQAMVAENTGLGYYECGASGNGYVVTTTQSGYYVAYLQYCDELSIPGEPKNEQVIQRFIETIAPWLDWGKSREEIEAQAIFCFGSDYGAQFRLIRAFNEASDHVWSLETSK